MSLALGSDTMKANGEEFEILSREEISMFGFEADRSAIYATIKGVPSTTLYTTLINQNTAIQFMTVVMGEKPSHKDYQIHVNFVSKFRMWSGVSSQ